MVCESQRYQQFKECMDVWCVLWRCRRCWGCESKRGWCRVSICWRKRGTEGRSEGPAVSLPMSANYLLPEQPAGHWKGFHIIVYVGSFKMFISNPLLWYISLSINLKIPENSIVYHIICKCIHLHHPIYLKHLVQPITFMLSLNTL